MEEAGKKLSDTRHRHPVSRNRAGLPSKPALPSDDASLGSAGAGAPEQIGAKCSDYPEPGASDLHPGSGS